MITTSYDDSSATASTTTTTPIDATTSLKQTTEFDGLGRTTRVITKDAANTIYSKVDTVYDSMGRTWKVSLPYTATASYWTETQYDEISRPLKVIPPDGSASANRIVYSYSGDTTTVTDQTGKERKSKSDALGRRIKVTEPDPANSDSLTLETDYTYDPLDNLTQISQGSQTRTYVYDDAGRKTSETTPEAGTVSYTYNSDNLVTTRTDARGVVTTYFGFLHKLSGHVLSTLFCDFIVRIKLDGRDGSQSWRVCQSPRHQLRLQCARFTQHRDARRPDTHIHLRRHGTTVDCGRS